MKITKQLAGSFILLIVIASLYRIMPGRPYGFAPQIAMAIFGGAIIKDKKFAFLLPLLAMFVSDCLYQLLYINGVGTMYGFYEGQVLNYILFGGLTVFGFFIKKLNVKRIAIASVAAPTAYFLASNFFVWASSSPLAGLGRPKTFAGLMMCYADGLPFYPWSVASTFVFSAILFGSYYLMTKRSTTLVAVKQ
ncbi:MAG TPA: DUF6580 family putative transport protein [Hanamia sp.]|jgi:hypothetical protein|nr:DUF6580 family putative transport protein [Hanamia sp.]